MSKKLIPSVVWEAFGPLLLLILAGCQTKAVGTPKRPLPGLPDRPNILLITLDTVRFDATSLAPNGGTRMPFLSSLARHGLNFTHAYSTWDETVGSHFSILTGYRSGLGSRIDTAKASLAYQLKRRGYTSTGVAANIQLSPHACRGLYPFDRYICLGDLWQDMTLDQRMAFFPEIDDRIAAYGGRKSDFNRLMLYTSGMRTLAQFKSLMDRTASPFFAFLNIVDAHDPYFPDPAHYDAKTAESGFDHRDFDGDLQNRRLGPELRNPSLVSDPRLRNLIQRKVASLGGRAWATAFDLHRDQLKIYRSRYLARVAETDRILASLFDYLRARHLLESTVVIITADHGESFGEASLITHSFADQGDHEATHHVPLLILFPPGNIIPGRVVETPCSLADLAPTIYDLARIDWSSLAGRTTPSNVGKSLLPLIDRSIERSPVMRGEQASPENPSEVLRSAKEREKRLRSLGYIN